MEDPSTELALVLPVDHSAIDTRLSIAREAGDDILAMIAAPQTPHRRQFDQD